MDNVTGELNLSIIINERVICSLSLEVMAVSGFTPISRGAITAFTQKTHEAGSTKDIKKL